MILIDLKLRLQARKEELDSDERVGKRTAEYFKKKGISVLCTK